MKERPLTHFARLSVVAAVITLVLKLIAWRLTGSVGLLSDALESLVNLAAAFVALGSLVVAVRPADEDHAFGHSKAEYLAAGIEGALILLAAVAIGWSARLTRNFWIMSASLAKSRFTCTVQVRVIISRPSEPWVGI